MRVAFRRYAQVVTARFISDQDTEGEWTYEEIEALSGHALRELLFEYGTQVTPQELKHLLHSYSTLDPPGHLAWEDTCELLGLPRYTSMVDPDPTIQDVVDEVVVNVECQAAVGLRVMLTKSATAALVGLDKDCAVGPGKIVVVHTSQDKPNSKVVPNPSMTCALSLSLSHTHSSAYLPSCVNMWIPQFVQATSKSCCR